MKAFAYRAPTAIEEAVALLAEYGSRARPLAGGTDLVPRLRAGLAETDLLIDLKRIPALNELHFDMVTGLTIGATVPCSRIGEHPAVAKVYPCLTDVTSLIGGAAIQSRATIGGNLCNASPSGDSIPALIVLRATCDIIGPEGRRSVPVERFCTSPGRTMLDPGEILVAIRLPPPGPRSGAAYLRFTPRAEMDIAVVGVGASLGLSEDHGTIRAAHVALGAVGPTPLYPEAIGAALVGRAPTEDAWNAAADLARQVARPISDVRGEASQRAHLVGVLTRRALRAALSRAKEGQP